MEHKETEIWRAARQYAVYISDKENTVHGSGVLFYPGEGANLYVLTCAHVADKVSGSDFIIRILIKTGKRADDYSGIDINVPRKQIIYSPDDEVTKTVTGVKHSCDAAVIWCEKPPGLVLKRYEYSFEDAESGVRLEGIGYPHKYKQNLLEVLQNVACSVYECPSREILFDVRIDDLHIDRSNKVEQLEGLSGSMLVDSSGSEVKICGLITNAFGVDADWDRIKAIKIKYIHDIMAEYFHINIKHSMSTEPEDGITAAVPADCGKMPKSEPSDECPSYKTFEKSVSLSDRREKEAVNCLSALRRLSLRDKVGNCVDSQEEKCNCVDSKEAENNRVNWQETEKLLKEIYGGSNPDARKIAANGLGDLCFKRKEFRESARWYAKAVFGGDFREESTEDDWKTPSEEGNPWGLYNLGFAFYQGCGVKKDLNCALKYFRMAKRIGNPYAAWILKAIEQGKLIGDENGDLEGS